MSADADRLHQLQAEFDAILEERITDLLSHVKAAQDVTARLAATQAEIRRHEQVKARLESDLGPLDKHAQGLSSETETLRKKVESLKGNIVKMRGQRSELAKQAKTLSAEAKSSGGK